MLVGTFEIEIGRRRHPARFEHEGVRGTRIEPDVENVGDALVFIGVVVVAQKVACRMFEPGIGAFLCHRGDDARIDLFVAQQRAVGFLDEERQRHAPGTLAREHPIGPPFHHRINAVAIARRHPADLLDLFQRHLPERLAARRLDFRVHRDEPLRRVAEDQGRLGAP